MSEVKEVKNPNDFEQGNISVHTENIFPIIKKSLYSDHEIFLRELVSNAVDATKKIKHIASAGKYEDDLGDLKIVVELDKENKTITIRDHGIGMTADEVRKYINQVAFSGAEEFVKKFKNLKDSKEIIGQFGLGFYSSFMVASEVEIISRSYRKNQSGVHWTCDGSTQYTLEKYARKDRGTDVILHIAEDSLEFLEPSRIRNILNKYCKFLPVEIEFEGEVINNIAPVWTKKPADLQDEDYLSFFRELYPYSEDPLFWIHLNVDFPFELTGILFFPKLKREVELRKDRIHLYSRQVFITDSVEQIVPDYLTLLQGVIDSPDIPLNVSRSYLQGDSNVRKISNYVTRKVTDKLAQLFKEEREKFAEKWNDIQVFVKLGMLNDDKFYERAMDFCLFSNVGEESFTLDEYRNKIREKQTDKDGNLVFLYTPDEIAQDNYVESARKKEYDVLVMNTLLDSHFIGMLERKGEKEQWKRVDSDAIDKLIAKEMSIDSLITPEQEKELEAVYKAVITDPGMSVSVQALGQDELPVLITRPEFMRRMRDMSALGGGMSGMGQFPEQFNVIVNSSHELAEKILGRKKEDSRQALASQLFDLAKLSQGMLNGKPLTQFIQRSLDIIAKK